MACCTQGRFSPPLNSFFILKGFQMSAGVGWNHVHLSLSLPAEFNPACRLIINCKRCICLENYIALSTSNMPALLLQACRLPFPRHFLFLSPLFHDTRPPLLPTPPLHQVILTLLHDNMAPNVCTTWLWGEWAFTGSAHSGYWHN